MPVRARLRKALENQSSKFFEVHHLLHCCLQLFFELGHVVAGQREILSGARHVGADFFGCARGIFEISADGLLNLLARVEQPENDEQRHHRSDKVGIRDLPRAPVVTAVAALLLENDDGTCLIHSCCRRT